MSAVTQFELLPSHYFFSILSLEFDEDTEPVNSNFGDMGYESNASIANMGPLFMYLTLLTLFSLIFLLLKKPMYCFNL